MNGVPQLKPLLDACAALVEGRPAEALPVLQQVHRATPPGSPEPTGILLAWALVGTGKLAEARPLLERNPIPDAMNDHPLLSLAWPRIVELRKAVR
jgi:hypothetical protein